MPLFTYECTECKNKFEKLVKKLEDVKECTKCKSKNVIRLAGNSSFILKGGGWSKDLYSSVQKTGGLARAPIYKDRNTGSMLGTGTPEFL